MAAPTIKTPNIVNADKAGIVSDPGTQAFNTQTDSLEYIKNDLSYVKLNPTSANTADTVVARDGSGDFSANIITAALNGNASSSSSTSGNAATATALQTARTIGGVSFDGTANIVPQTIQSVNEASDTTCFPLFISASGSQSLQPLNSTKLTYDALTGNVGMKYLTFAGGTPSTGTETIVAVGADGSYADGNFVTIGNGSNIGRSGGGSLFLTNNADYNGSGTIFQYGVTAAAFVIDIGGATNKGSLQYAPSGTAGSAITFFNALTWDTLGNVELENGELSISKVGKGLSIKSGSDARIGTGATLIGGSTTVNTTAVATGDVILITCTAAGGTQGFIRYSIVNATSFTITSSSALDTSTFSWVIVRPT